MISPDNTTATLMMTSDGMDALIVLTDINSGETYTIRFTRKDANERFIITEYNWNDSVAYGLQYRVDFFKNTKLFWEDDINDDEETIISNEERLDIMSEVHDLLSSLNLGII